MRKSIAILTALVLGAGVAQAALQGNVYHGNANDSDFNNAINWWNPVTSNDMAYFRGDNIAVNPGRATVNLSAPLTISRINYQGSILAGAAYNITGSGGALTIDADPENNLTQLIDVFNAVTANQTISADLVLDTASNANNAHIRTGTGAGLILSGAVSQIASSSGVGFSIGNGDIEMAGSVSGSKLWKVRDNGGTGVLKVTGTWLGGTLQIDANTGVLLSRSVTDSTALSGTILQLVGGDLVLGNDEQLADNMFVSYAALSAGTFNLDGNTETIGGLNFTATDGSQSGSIDMGVNGILHLMAQDDTAKWGNLTILNWNDGSDHIYVDGGTFSEAQLSTITFDGSGEIGAQILGGELVAIPEPATLGLIGFISAGIFGLRRLMI